MPISLELTQAQVASVIAQANQQPAPEPEPTPDPAPQPDPTPEPVQVDTTGAESWDSFYGKAFGSTFCDKAVSIPAGGKAVWFRVPDTVDKMKVVFTSIEVTSIKTNRTLAVNRAVLDFESEPKITSALGGGLSMGINANGEYGPELVPGEVRIFNFRNDNPSGSNVIRVQVVARKMA